MIRYPITQPDLRRFIDSAAPSWRAEAKRRTQHLKSSHQYGKITPFWNEINHAYQWLQQNKCGFCERLLITGYGESFEYSLEHFRPKRLYPLLTYNILNFLLVCKTCNTLKGGKFPIEGETTLNLEDPARGKSEKPLLIYPIGTIDDDPESLIGFEGIIAVPRSSQGYKRRRAEATIDLFRLNNRETLLAGRANQITKVSLVLALLENAAGQDAEATYKSTLDRLISSAASHASCSRSFLRLHAQDRARADEIARLSFDYLEATHTPASFFVPALEPSAPGTKGRRASTRGSIRQLAHRLSAQLARPDQLMPGDFAFLEEVLDDLQQVLAKRRSGTSMLSPAAGPAIDRILDTQSREQILIGKMLEICGRAGQIFRPTSQFDVGIDGEIEFKDKEGVASGDRIYVQLKSGPSYLRYRQRDQKLIFDIHKERHISYWQKQRYDVFLVILDGDDVLRWMNVSAYLKERHDKASRQIEFDGELLDVAAVLSMRDKVLAEH